MASESSATRLETLRRLLSSDVPISSGGGSSRPLRVVSATEQSEPAGGADLERFPDDGPRPKSGAGQEEPFDGPQHIKNNNSLPSPVLRDLPYGTIPGTEGYVVLYSLLVSRLCVC